MKGLITDFPPAGTTMYVFEPYYLGTMIRWNSVEKYIPCEYHNSKIQSGYCFYDFESLNDFFADQRQLLKERQDFWNKKRSET